MDTTKQEESTPANGDAADTVDPSKDAPMDIVVDEIKEDTAEPAKGDKNEPEAADDTTNTMDLAEDKEEVEEVDKDEKEEKKVAVEETTDQSTESGKKKRKKSIQASGETTTTTATTATAAAVAKESADTTKRSSRERKSIEVFNPESYDKTDKTVHVIDGRGTALKHLPPCVESIASASTDDIVLAHKFVFVSRFKVLKRDMVQQLLDFSGYLAKKESSMSKSELEKLDDECEAKFGGKAYKMTIPALKKLCDFFVIDRYSTQTKDGLVEKLLDFLGAPNKSKLKGSGSSNNNAPATAATTAPKTKKSKMSNSKSKSKTEKSNDEEEIDEENEEEAEEEDDDDYDDVDDDKLKDDDETELPSQERLRKWVRAYVRCFNKNKLTVNHALEIGSEKFGLDLLPMKAALKKLLIEEL